MHEQKVIVSVGAVVFRGEEALLIRRGKPPFKGRWSIPGGKIEFGERAEDAVAREVMEETGVSIRIGGLIGVFEAVPGAHVEIDRHIVMIDYWAEWVSGEPKAGDDAIAAEFAPLKEALDRVFWEETRVAIAKAAKLRNTAKERP